MARLTTYLENETRKIVATLYNQPKRNNYSSRLMCYHSKQTKSAQELKQRFKANFFEEEQYTPNIYNGFSFPKTPVIANNNSNNIQLFNWGLIPPWAKDTDIRKNTLNARIETLHEKPSFKSSLKNRCLVLSDGFYEWQWLDEKGKNKQKYQISLPDNEAFALASLVYLNNRLC